MIYKFTLSKALKHWKVVRRHRRYVRQYCFKAKLYRQGLMHDLSKYSPTEFIESVKYFTGTHSPIDECKSVNSYSAAWMHHKARNKHHREYWTDNYDKGTTFIKMPWKYALECFCDYLGAGRAYNNGVEDVKGEYRWWISNCTKMKMHEDTFDLLDSLFGVYRVIGADLLDDRELLSKLKRSYEKQHQVCDSLIKTVLTYLDAVHPGIKCTDVFERIRL